MAGNAIAAPFVVPVGDARLALDAPPGFSDTQFTGSPRLIDLAESLTPASNRIVLFALEDADLRRFMVGDSPELRRYVLAVTPKGLERERLTPAAFGLFVSESLRELGSAPQGGDLLKYLDSQPRGRPSLLGELRKDPDAVSVLQGARQPSARSSDTPRYLLSTTTLMLVRGKALNLSVYSLYDSAADLDWIRTTTSRWVDELQRLNAR